MSNQTRWGRALAALTLVFGVGALVAGSAQADPAGKEAVVWWNDINNVTADVTFPDSTDGASSSDGNSKNRSGLGDGSNPGQGAGRSNSKNEGTDNPNQTGGKGPRK